MSADTPTPEVCRWWLKNHVCMPRDWKPIAELYEQAKAKGETQMRTTSEYCSVGHPDRTCDFISSYLLDRYLEQDPYTRYAVEVQMKDNAVRLGGEVTSKAKLTKAQRAAFVREAVARVGYDAKYALKWGAENVPCSEDLVVTEFIGEQSPDIAMGVNADGWGDQGIFWGMAVKSPSTGDMPYDHFLARKSARRFTTSASAASTSRRRWRRRDAL